MTKEEEAISGCVLGLIFVPINIVISCLMDGWVVVKLWAWFILPTFTSAPPLTRISAVGLGLAVAYLTHRVYPAPSDEKWNSVIARGLISSVFLPLWFLLIAYIVHQFA